MSRKPLADYQRQPDKRYLLTYVDGTNEIVELGKGEILGIGKEVKKYKESLMNPTPTAPAVQTPGEQTPPAPPVAAPTEQAPTDLVAKRADNEPWRTSNLLDVTLKDEENYGKHWSRPDKVNKRIFQGWEMCTQDMVKEQPGQLFLDSKAPVDAPVKANELILMRIRRDRLKARDEHYAKLSKGREMTVRNMKESLEAETGVPITGTVNLS